MNRQEKKLLDLYRGLPREVAEQLLAYAEFLAQRHPPEAMTPAAPLDIPRPGEETVIAAVKRLSRTYPMLNKDTMLHETSGLVAQHLLQGRAAQEVIDELEMVFRREYEKHSQPREADDHA
ncbi:MAG TPA: Crp/Fnr family transcriptional regulator [Chromatiales bacterium]|nr:Crp/Fnr family transcriptional regulator [Chromatiales bacterium]